MTTTTPVPKKLAPFEYDKKFSGYKTTRQGYILVHPIKLTHNKQYPTSQLGVMTPILVR